MRLALILPIVLILAFAAPLRAETPEVAGTPECSDSARSEARRITDEGEKILRADRARADEALALFQKASGLCARDERVQNALGSTFELKENYPEAYRHYERAHALAPGWKLPLYGMADVRRKQGLPRDAMRLYSEGLSLPATSADDRIQDDDASKRLVVCQRNLDTFRTAEDFFKVRSGESLPSSRVTMIMYGSPEASPHAVGGESSPAPASGPSPVSKTCYQRFDLEVRFLRDSAKLMPHVTEQLDELARALLDPKWGDKPVRLVGHASPEGTEAHNMDLSRRRVQETQRYLGKRGVKQALITIDWKGPHFPILKRDGSVDYEASRRVGWEMKDPVPIPCPPATGAGS